MTRISTPDGKTVTLPAPFVLPRRASAWRRFLSSVHLVTLTAAEKSYELYGGSTMNWALDGSRRWFLGCNAINSANDLFAFYVFLFQNGALTNVALPEIGEGRGWMDVQPDGQMYWGAWDGSSYVPHTGPGRVPGASLWPASGGYTLAPNGSVRVFVDQDGFDGQQTISLASYGIPVCSALNVRLSLDADAGRIFRCGPQVADPNLQAAAMLTVTGLGVANRAYESGVIGASAARTLLVATEKGPIAKGWVDVIGWWG